MADVICFASSKGGSGKTTITASIGTFLAKTGRKVLLVDCDEGTHGLTLMYLEEVNNHRKKFSAEVHGIFEMDRPSASYNIDMSLVSLKENLHLLPAKFTFSDSDTWFSTDFFDANLSIVCKNLRNDFDFILLDAQAGISPASIAAMRRSNSDSVILVSEYDPLSNAGIERLKAKLPEELYIARTQILLNKLLPEFVSKFSEFLSFANYLPPIPWTADVVRSYSRRTLALDFDNGNQFTLALLSVLKVLLNREELELLDAWIKQQTNRIREPIEKQLAETEMIIHNLESLSKLQDRGYLSFLRKIIFAKERYFIIVVAASIFMTIFIDNNLSEILSKVFDIRILSVFEPALLAAAILTLGLLMLEIIGKNNSNEKIERIKEISNLRKRAQELRELASSDYEKIIEKQSKKIN